MKFFLAYAAMGLALLSATWAQEPSPTASPTATPSPSPTATPLTGPAPLESILLRPSPWSAAPADLQADLHNLEFQWLSTAQDSAHTTSKRVTFLGLPVAENILRFTAGKLSSATLLFYDRSVSREMMKGEFTRYLDTLSQKLTALTGQPPTERGRDASNAVRADGRIWRTATSKYLLEWSYTRETVSNPFRAEFIRLTVQPKGLDDRPIGGPVATAAQLAVQKFSVADHLVKEPSGDVKLKGVPMVDQGNRGYCATASLERVMRYYGLQIDQQELAQLANSDADRGTNTDAMIQAVRKISSRLRVKIRSLYEMSEADFEHTLDEYNRAAKKAKELQLNLGARSLDALFQNFLPSIYREVRLRKTMEFERFQRDIKANVDAGMPLLWGVEIGLVKEKGLPSNDFGGHMRLIIGYNEKTREIIYTDSWGAGHEEKRMSVEDAWSMSLMLDSLQPILS